jgi:hypothetical protein
MGWNNGIEHHDIGHGTFATLWGGSSQDNSIYTLYCSSFCLHRFLSHGQYLVTHFHAIHCLWWWYIYRWFKGKAFYSDDEGMGFEIWSHQLDFFIYSLSMALQLFVAPWPLFQFLNPIQRRGISPSQGLYLYTEQHKHRQIPMPSVGFEPAIPVLERAKIVH